MFFISRPSSCPVIHVNEDTKLYAKVRLVSVIVVVVVVFFFALSLSPGGHAIYRPNSSGLQIHPVLHEGVDVLTFVRTIFSEPKFLGCKDDQIFLPMVLR